MRSERVLASFIEQAPTVIAMFDCDMRYLATSGGWRKDYHLNSDLTGKSHYEVFPEISQDWREVHRRALAGEVLREEKNLFLRLDGSAQWLKWEVRPWYRAGAKIGGVVIFSEDITEHVKVHEALRVSEERFRLVANITNDVIFDWDLGSGEVWWNEGLSSAFGLGPDPIGAGIGAWMDRIYPADRQRVSQAIQSFIEGHHSRWSDEYRVVQAGGATTMVVDNRCIIRDAGGKATRMFGCIVDVTKHKLADERLRLVVEASPNGMVMADHLGKIAMINRETERLFAYRREELIGQPIDILLPVRLRSRHASHREQFTRHPEARRMGAGRDLFGLRKDGTEFPVEVGLNPIQTSEGLVVLSVIVDISERKRIERLKDEFVSTVSHELRTPLTSIFASLGLLTGTADANLPETTKRLIAIAHSNSQRLVRLINDILDMEKIESGKVIFNLQRVEVRWIIAQAIEANRAHAGGYGVTLRLDDSSLHEVRADPDRLMQVVINLLSNAIKFSPPQAEVVAAVENRGEHVRITVRDHGPGIPENFRSRIFEKFAQADGSNARQKGGTGLGLSIVKQIVTRLDGEVGFTDAVGGGTIFYVELPSLDFAGQVRAESSNKFGARILLCEYDADAATVMRDRLGEEGFATDLAQTAAGAIAQATMEAYFAILVDLRLPGGDGISLIQQLRAQPQHGDTPIVVVSANSGRGGEDFRLSSLIVLDWLSKPLDIPRLMRTLRPPIARSGGMRLRVLHLDDDAGVLGIVAQALDVYAQVVSVATVEDARRALAASHFDLAVIDLALDSSSGLDLLPELNDSSGAAIPVIVYSAHGANPVCAMQVQAVLTKSRASIDSLIEILRRQAAPRAPDAGGPA
jgi:PAS domain S-box-containing protein